MAPRRIEPDLAIHRRYPEIPSAEPTTSGASPSTWDAMRRSERRVPSQGQRLGTQLARRLCGKILKRWRLNEFRSLPASTGIDLPCAAIYGMRRT
jgi:hypothetical protein